MSNKGFSVCLITILEYRYFIMHLLISNIRTELRVLKNIHIFINCLLSGLTDRNVINKAIREYMAVNQSNWVTINILNYLPLKFLLERLYISCVLKVELNIYILFWAFMSNCRRCFVLSFISNVFHIKKLKYVTTCVHLWVIQCCFQTVHWLSIPITVCDLRKTPNLSWKFSLSPHQVKTQYWVLHLLFCKSATTVFANYTTLQRQSIKCIMDIVSFHSFLSVNARICEGRVSDLLHKWLTVGALHICGSSSFTLHSWSKYLITNVLDTKHQLIMLCASEVIHANICASELSIDTWHINLILFIQLHS